MVTVHYYSFDEYGYCKSELISSKKYRTLTAAMEHLERNGFIQVTELFNKPRKYRYSRNFYKSIGGKGIQAMIINA